MLNMAMGVWYMIIWTTVDDGWIERFTLLRTGLGKWVGLENPGNNAGRP